MMLSKRVKGMGGHTVERATGRRIALSVRLVLLLAYRLRRAAQGNAATAATAVSQPATAAGAQKV